MIFEFFFKDVSSSSDEYDSLSSESDSESFTVASDHRIDHYNENYAAYDDNVEPVPNEEEALQCAEQLALEEEEEEETLLARFSGEDDSRRKSKYVFEAKTRLLA